MTTNSARRKRSVPLDPGVSKIGHATVRLHRILRELGYTRNLEKSAATMPDARERLSFIDKSMHDASERTITAVEASTQLTARNRKACRDLVSRLSSTRFGEHDELVEETLWQLGEIATAEETIHHNLMQIMEAQEFRDVAGQMVNKIVGAAVEIEDILLDILKEYAPDKKDSLIGSEGLSAGPAIRTDDSVSGQEEVDDLLASLGF